MLIRIPETFARIQANITLGKEAKKGNGETISDEALGRLLQDRVRGRGKFDEDYHQAILQIAREYALKGNPPMVARALWLIEPGQLDLASGISLLRTAYENTTNPDTRRIRRLNRLESRLTPGRLI